MLQLKFIICVQGWSLPVSALLWSYPALPSNIGSTSLKNPLERGVYYSLLCSGIRVEEKSLMTLKRDRQVLMWSATWPKTIEKLVRVPML
jgi:hypothetical protein